MAPFGIAEMSLLCLTQVGPDGFPLMAGMGVISCPTGFTGRVAKAALQVALVFERIAPYVGRSWLRYPALDRTSPRESLSLIRSDLLSSQGVDRSSACGKSHGRSAACRSFRSKLHSYHRPRDLHWRALPCSAVMQFGDTLHEGCRRGQPGIL